MLVDVTPTAVTAPAIQAILEKNYGVNGEGFYPMNQILSEKILTLLNSGDLETIEKRVMILIWNNYSGGDLAESVANEIVETFSIV